MRQPILTERFILREIQACDLQGMFDLDNDPLVHKYLQEPIVSTLDQAKQVIDFITKQYSDNKIGRWAIIDKQTNDFIGWAGLKLVKEPTNGHVDYYDLGYRLIQKYWNKAIASEVAKAWCVYAFNQMSIQTLYAAADLENIGSNKVLTKIGFKCIEQFSYHGVLHNWYKLEKHDFKNMI